jgi:hypothetical protein
MQTRAFSPESGTHGVVRRPPPVHNLGHIPTLPLWSLLPAPSPPQEHALDQTYQIRTAPKKRRTTPTTRTFNQGRNHCTATPLSACHPSVANSRRRTRVHRPRHPMATSDGTHPCTHPSHNRPTPPRLRAPARLRPDTRLLDICVFTLVCTAGGKTWEKGGFPGISSGMDFTQGESYFALRNQ